MWKRPSTVDLSSLSKKMTMAKESLEETLPQDMNTALGLDKSDSQANIQAEALEEAPARQGATALIQGAIKGKQTRQEVGERKAAIDKANAIKEARAARAEAAKAKGEAANTIKGAMVGKAARKKLAAGTLDPEAGAEAEVGGEEEGQTLDGISFEDLHSLLVEIGTVPEQELAEATTKEDLEELVEKYA